jgi:hypothetical protein
MKPNFKSTPARCRPRLFPQILLHFKLGDFLAQPRYFRILRRHFAVARECLLGLHVMLAYPFPRDVSVYVQILSCLAKRHATLLNQLYSLELELAA